MRRGTRVGQAYIAVTADGSGINEDIVDSVESAGPDVQRAGEDHGDLYGDGFSEGFLDRLRGRLPGMRDRLRERLGGGGRETGKDFTDGLTASIDDDFIDRIGERLGARMGGHLVDALNHAMTTDGFDDNALRVVYQRLNERSDSAGEEAAEMFAARFVDTLEDQLKTVDFDSLLVSGNRGGGRTIERSLGDRIGRLFGAGSRNNFLNLFGKSLGGIFSLTEKVTQGAMGMFDRFSKGFSQASEGASFFQKTLSGLGGVFGKGGGFLSRLAASGPAAIAGTTAVIVALSALASIVGALIGLVTALASTIVSGLVGALAVAAPAVAGLVAAVGLLTAAFMSMDDTQKRILKDAFVPLRQQMVGIGQLMIQQMVPAFKTWSTNLQNALMLAVPLAQRLGSAFAEAGNIITASLSGPGFQRFAAALGTYLPNIITRLSTALGGFMNGLAGMFAAIMPQVSLFAGWLQRVAERFSNWANSTAGQNAIEDFVTRAVASLQSLWNFAKQFFGFLADVFFSPDAQNAGNTIFDSLANAFRDMRDAIQKAIENGDLQRWFEDAIKFGSALWEVVKGLYDIFIAFYNSGVLQFVAAAFEGMGKTMQFTSSVIGAVVDNVLVLVNPLLGIANAILNVGGAVQWLKGLVGGAGKLPGEGLPTAGSAASAAANGGVSGPPIKMPTLPDLQLSGANAMANTATKAAKNAAKKFKNPYLAFANQILADAPGVAASIKNALLDINEQVTDAINDAAGASGGDSVTSALSSLADSIVSSAEQTVNSAQQTLYSAANSLASASSMKAANKALKEVKRAQRGVAAAQRDQARIQAVADMLAAQSVQTESNILALVSGNLRVNYTLADIAEARARVAELITDANAKLVEAIQIRDSYAQQIADSIRSFGSLLGAQAQTINGVQQALTANDIIGNLEDRLAKVKKFQENLRLLLAQGISQDVYRQLVEAGVDGGSAYADALVAGGPGAINTVNQLVSDINKTADQVGSQAGDRLYQAGVDGAQALLDGLTSLESQLINAGETLGSSIAAAIARGLGISAPTPAPSTVGGGGGGGKGGSGGISVGDGLGLNTPNTGRPVSGAFDPNATWGAAAPLVGQIIVQTPTEDPYAVATETVNEIVGRIL